MPDTTTPATTAEPGDSPWRYDTVTAAVCRHCQAAVPAGRPRDYCSNRCRQAAYRRRSNPTRLPLPAAPPAGRTRTDIGVYECPTCNERMLGQRRCPDCNTFARRLGDGGYCNSCAEIITTNELLNPT